MSRVHLPEDVEHLWTDDEDSEEPDEMTVEEADAELTDAWLPLYRAWNDERLAAFATRISRELGL